VCEKVLYSTPLAFSAQVSVKGVLFNLFVSETDTGHGGHGIQSIHANSIHLINITSGSSKDGHVHKGRTLDLISQDVPILLLFEIILSFNVSIMH